METRVKESLISLLNGIKAADGPTVAAEMARLDGWLAEGEAGLHPQLAHYLQNRSYAKAALWLGVETGAGAAAPTNPPGGCGRHA